MNNKIEFVGLCLFVEDRAPLTAVLGDFHGHDRMIAVHQGTAKYSAAWKPTGSFTNNGFVWDYFMLTSGVTIQFTAGTGAAPGPITWLSGLKTDCCPKFVLFAQLPSVVTVLVEQASLTCTQDGNRVDTMWNLATQSGLVITSQQGSITFAQDAEVIVVNTPLGSLDGVTPVLHSAGSHYMHYYELGAGAGCTAVPNPADPTSPCTKNTKCSSGVPPLIKLHAPAVVPLGGVEIDCSNSHYP